MTGGFDKGDWEAPHSASTTGATVNIFSGRAIARVDIGFDVGIAL